MKSYFPVKINMMGYSPNIKVFLNRESLIKFAKRKHKEDKQFIEDIKTALALAHTINYVDKHNKPRVDFIMLLPEEYKLGYVVHECVHMAWMLLSHNNIKIGVNLQEPQALLVEHLVSEIDKQVYNNTLKNYLKS